MRLNHEIDEIAYHHEKKVLEAMWFDSDAKPICPFPPRGIWIEITTYCTLNCKFCAHQTMKRPKGEMDIGLFKKIIKDISKMLDDFGDREMTEIALTRWGEPLMNKNLEQFIKIVKDHGLYAYLPTNGTIMTEKQRDMLLGSGLDKMNISVDTIHDERHQEVMGIPIHKRLINILSLFRERFVRGVEKPVIEVSMVKYPGYEREIELFKQFFEVISADRTNVGDCFNLMGTVDIDFDPDNKTAPCINPWYCIGIYWDGRCNFCLQDPEGDETCIGNCAEVPLYEIWNNKEAQRIREAVWKGDYDKFPPCKNCNVNVYRRYQQKPFFEAFVNYAQRMRSLDPSRINLSEYTYLTHLQSIVSGSMIKKNWKRSIGIIDEVIIRLKSGRERFFDIAQSIVDTYGTGEKKCTKL